jgi:hypothetical protein
MSNGKLLHVLIDLRVAMPNSSWTPSLGLKVPFVTSWLLTLSGFQHQLFFIALLEIFFLDLATTSVP